MSGQAPPSVSYQQQQQQPYGRPPPPAAPGQPGYYVPSPQQQGYARSPYSQTPQGYGSPAPSAAYPPLAGQPAYRPPAMGRQGYSSVPPQPLPQAAGIKRPAPQARAPSVAAAARPPYASHQQQQQQQQQAYPQTSFLPPQHSIPAKAVHRDPHRYTTMPPPPPLPPYYIAGQAGSAPTPASSSASTSEPGAPLPLFAPITNPKYRLAQAFHTSYASRLRTGVSLLMQPILVPAPSAPGAGGAGGAQTGRRRGAVNYAEVDKEITDPSDSDDDASDASSSSGSAEEADGNFSGRAGRTLVKSRRIAGAPAPGGARGGMGAGGKSGVEKSYLGELPPVDKVVVKVAKKTAHSYHPTEALAAAATLKETLVPIRIELDTPTHRIRDAFLWNVHETLATPDEFALVFCADLELDQRTYAQDVAAQIRAQMEEFKGVAEMDVEYDGEHVPVNEDAEDADLDAAAPEQAEDTPAPPPQAAPVSIVVDPPAEDAQPSPAPTTAASSPGKKRKRLAGDDGADEDGEGGTDEEAEDAEEEEDVDEVEQEAHEEAAAIDESVQESDCRIIVNLDVQLSNYALRDRIEWDLSSPLDPSVFASSLCSDLGLPSSCVPLLAHAVHEELLRHKKDCLELGFVGAGWSAGQGKTQGGKVVGPKRLEGAWRHWEEGSEFEPTLREVDEEEMEKREAERERSSRRMRRETARFSTRRR